MVLASSNEKNTGPTAGPWMIVPPGGPQGPFYGLMNSQGNVVALQIVGEANAQLMAASIDLLEACTEFVAKVDRGEAHSVRSYAQMKAAIAKAEGGTP